MKAKGRMTGEADRGSAETAWELVNDVRNFGKSMQSLFLKPGLRGDFVEANGFCRERKRSFDWRSVG